MQLIYDLVDILGFIFFSLALLVMGCACGYAARDNEYRLNGGW